MTRVLDILRLTVRYGGITAIDIAELAVAGPTVCAIVGPNGAGKSTLLKAVLGLIEADSAKIQVAGASGKAILERVAYVPQRASVDWDFPLSVRDVVAQGRARQLGLLGRPTQADLALIDSAIDKLGLRDLATRQIGELSGGQQQRTFVARALAQDADVYFLDEPFVGVDASTERVIAQTLRSLKSAGKSLFVVHHDLSTVRAYFDQIVLLNRGIVASGSVEHTFTNENLQQTFDGRLLLGNTDNHHP